MTLSMDVKSWNNNVAVGATVIYRDDTGQEILARTRARAQVLSNYTAVVWIEGREGCVRLDRIIQVA
jgi:hypothetical protein